MKYLGFLMIIISFSVGCKEVSEANTKDSSVSSQNEPPEALGTNGLPSIPTALLEQIFLECDFVDYIFYELPFSMSYDKQSTIQSALRWVNQSTKIPTSGCKPLGRMIFQKKGDIMIEAELYVSDTCAYYKWILDGKAMYNNLMSESGIVHYSGIMKQFENQEQ